MNVTNRKIPLNFHQKLAMDENKFSKNSLRRHKQDYYYFFLCGGEASGDTSSVKGEECYKDHDKMLRPEKFLIHLIF